MVNFYRLILFAALGVFSVSNAGASFPLKPTPNEAAIASFYAAGVAACVANGRAGCRAGFRGEGPTSYKGYSAPINSTLVFVEFNNDANWDSSVIAYLTGCPAGASQSGGMCTCPADQAEVNGTCKPKKSDQCGDLEGKSLGLGQMEISLGVTSNAALAGMIGKAGTSCFPGGCTVSGTVSGCVNAGAGGASCIIQSPSFSGAACDDKKDPDKGCPAGTTPSAYAAGVCIPDKNDCPSGSSPSKYASGVCIPDENPCPSGQSPSKYAQGVCLPNEDPNANGDKGDGDKNKCQKGYVPSKYAAGVCIPATTATDKDGTTTCVDNVCTTRKPDGTTEEKPKEDFCTEKPDSPLCVKGEFAGSCSTGFQCKGDAIQCAIVQEQHKRSCRLFDEKSAESALYEFNKGKEGNQTLDLPGNSTVDLGGRISSADILGAGSGGVQDLSVTVWGQNISLPFSILNQYLAYMGYVLVAVSFLLAIRIIGRG